MGIRPTHKHIENTRSFTGQSYAITEKGIKYTNAMLAIEENASKLPNEIVELLEMMIGDMYAD